MTEYAASPRIIELHCLWNISFYIHIQCLGSINVLKVVKEEKIVPQVFV